MSTRIRVKEMKMVAAELLEPHPGNFRVHTPEQRSAMDDVLSEVGFAGAVLVRELEDGRYQVLDGHLRVEEMAGQQVPVLVTDLSEIEARKVLATFDAVGSMADVDVDGLRKLLDGIEWEHNEIEKLIAETIGDDQSTNTANAVVNPISLTEMECRNVKRVWILIGVDQGEYFKIQQTIDEMKMVVGVVYHITAESAVQDVNQD